MNIRTQQLLSRIPDHSSSTKLKAAAAACLDVAERFSHRATSINGDPSFTQVGRDKVLTDEALKTFLPGLKEAYRPIAAAFADVKTAKAAISIPAPDPSNVAAALERQEIRALVRSMRPAERMGFLMGAVDERIVDAIISAPGFLAGLSDDQFSQIRDLAVNRRFGDRVAEIREAEEAAEAAQAAVLVAKNDIRAATGLDERAFDRMEKQAVITPWLKRYEDGILKVIPGETSYPRATADEIATGKFYASKAEYLADNPGARLAAAA
ncbi:hypothetical protein NKI12_19390 [Mesorhizobium australicum]|uniref:Uncharacterized protein n=1 Tax=Mesorhizobium australicum TaxID=536018 RepID=A0ACC6SZ82_9HYPH